MCSSILSQITTQIRLYNSECNQTAVVLEAIKQSKTNLKVFLGIYRGADEDDYQHQKTALKEALQTYGTSNVLGIAVEYMLKSRARPTNNTTRPPLFEGEYARCSPVLTLGLQSASPTELALISRPRTLGACFLFHNVEQ